MVTSTVRYRHIDDSASMEEDNHHHDYEEFDLANRPVQISVPPVVVVVDYNDLWWVEVNCTIQVVDTVVCYYLV